MATAFTAQLRTIAANSTNELDLRARRDAHGESLIFERSVAVKQDWDTLYQICFEGFRELCLLDARLREFENNLFSPQAKDQDREQLNKAQNEALNVVIEQCLARLGARLVLSPGIRAVEWLVRRFKIHTYNTAALLLTVLPYHETPLVQNVLSIIPAGRFVDEWKFLRPYHKATTNIPRHAIVYAATNNDPFFLRFNQHVLRVCRNEASYSGLLRMWSIVVVEAVAGRLNQAKSGRKEVQRTRTEDVLRLVLPVINDGIETANCPELTMACFTIAIVVAVKGDLSDDLLDSMTEAILETSTYSDIDTDSILICASIFAAQKSEPQLSHRVITLLMKVPNIGTRLVALQTRCAVGKLVLATVKGCLSGLKQKNIGPRLDFLRDLLSQVPLLHDAGLVHQCLEAVVNETMQHSSTGTSTELIQSQLLDLLRKLSPLEDFSKAFSSIQSARVGDGMDIEALLGTTVPLLEPESPETVDVMDVDLTETSDRVMTLLGSLSERRIENSSFLAQPSHDLFAELLHTLELCEKKQSLLDQFVGLQIWQSETSGLMSLVTFLLCVSCGPSSGTTRITALKLLTSCIKKHAGLDMQILLPYVSCLLADPLSVVRRGAQMVVLAMEDSASQSPEPGKETDPFGSADLYEQDALSKLSWLQSNQVVKIIQQVFVPYLEECVMDSSQVHILLRNTFNGSPETTTQSPHKSTNIEIKKTLRHNFFELLTSHAIATPLFRVKTGIVQLLDGVNKVGTSTKSKTLMPSLITWASLSLEQATQSVASEEMQVKEVDRTLLRIISPQDRDSFNRCWPLLEKKEAVPRWDFVGALFDRVITVWSKLRDEDQHRYITLIFDLAFSDTAAIARGSRAVLQKVTLSAQLLVLILEHVSAGMTDLLSEEPPKKKRRTSGVQEERVPLQHDSLPARVALALEIVDGCKPENHPELLKPLFDVMINLRRLKEHQRTESPYVLNLCLSSILAIVDKATTLKNPAIDVSAIRADLITDCVRTSADSQVQTTALLTSAALAKIAPERMLHNIMPIFTFMGSKFFAKDDEHSVNVVNQALDQIVPPLVSSLKRKNESNLIRAAAGLLSSFSAAFDHINVSRRINFYRRLLQRLGPDDFAFAIIAMLASRFPEEIESTSFLDNVMADFAPSTYLVTYRNLVTLAQDVFADQPHNAEPLLRISSSSAANERYNAAFLMFSTAKRILDSKMLKQSLLKLEKRGGEHIVVVQHEFKLALQQILQTIKDQKSHGAELATAARQCLSGLLELIPLTNLFELLPGLLSELEAAEGRLHIQALRVLAAQIRIKPVRNSQTQSAATAYLAELENIVKISNENGFKQAAIACIDTISEVYGRKDTDAVLSAANVLASDAGLGSDDQQTQVMSLLTLASMLDVLEQAAVPIIPEIMPRALTLLENSIQSRTITLHDAVYSIFSAISAHVSFMISEDYLDQILNHSALAASTNIPNETRKDALMTLAKKLDIDMMVVSLSSNWDQSARQDIHAVLQILDILAEIVEGRPKSSVARSADAISTFMLKVMDLRRSSIMQDNITSLTDKHLEEVDTRLNEILIKFIYKLNDTTFRPIFESWTEWALQSRDVSGDANLLESKTLRQISLFKFLDQFFTTLKSIVTSYASYIIDPTNEILQTMSSLATTTSIKKQASPTPEILDLYTSVLNTLTSTFTHDADGFFSAPSHFQPLATNLTSQLSIAHFKPIRPLTNTHVIPTLIALATATIDSPSHHHAINHSLCQLRHSDHAAVRLASITTQIRLTEDPDVGDEWINNIIGTAASGTALTDADTTTAEAGEGGRRRGASSGGGSRSAVVGGAGETMVYVNEMLEDDDEFVEKEVRRWVRMVREKVGEDVFET